jgi:hypothetical protein
MLDVLFWRAGGFSCNLEALYGGPSVISKSIYFQLLIFFQFLVINTLDEYRYSAKMLNPDSIIRIRNTEIQINYLSPDPNPVLVFTLSSGV